MLERLHTNGPGSEMPVVEFPGEPHTRLCRSDVRIAIHVSTRADAVNLFGLWRSRFEAEEIIDGLSWAIGERYDVRRVNWTDAVIPETPPSPSPSEVILNLSHDRWERSPLVDFMHYFHERRVPIVGSPVRIHRRIIDKVRTKTLLEAAGLPVARTIGPSTSPTQYGFPLVVKPRYGSCSCEVSVVNSTRELRRCTERIQHRLSQPSLIEEFLPGEEVTIGVLETGRPEPSALCPLRLDVGPSQAIYSEAIKRSRSDEYRSPVTEEADRAAVERLAIRCFQILGVRDLARVDIRRDANGEPRILEVNSLPSIARTSLMTRAAEWSGYDHGQLVQHVVQQAGQRVRVGSRQAQAFDSE